MLTDLTKARPLIRIELTVKSPNCGHLISGLVDCVATLDFVSEDFVRRFTLQTRNSHTKTPFRLANCQRETSSTVCDITLEVARREFQRTLHVTRYVIYKGRKAKFYAIDISPATEPPAEFHTREALTAKQPESFLSLPYDDFPELLQ
jgi:hypothetical protein